MRLSFKRVKQQLLILLPFVRLFDFSSSVVLERIAPTVGGEYFPNAQVLCFVLPGIDNDLEQEVPASLVKFPISPCTVATLLAKFAGFACEDKKDPHHATNEWSIFSPTLCATHVLLQRTISAETFGLHSSPGLPWKLAGISHPALASPSLGLWCCNRVLNRRAR
jgi:hypothetical protein